MGNGSSSQQQRGSAEEQDHTYEEIQESGMGGKNRFQRNCSIVTLDIKPGEWRRFAEAQRSTGLDEVGGRDVWWGGDHQSRKRGMASRYPEEMNNTRGRGEHQGGWKDSQGGWEASSNNIGWRDEGVGRWGNYKRCVSMDVKQIDPDLEEKSDF